MKDSTLTGLVLKKYSGFYYVEDDAGRLFECKLRGKIKNEVLTGDRVIFTKTDSEKGILEKVLPRESELYRPRIANVNAVVIVLANDRPAPNVMFLDRLLLLALYNRLTPTIVINKCDLEESDKAREINGYYPKAGFNIIHVSGKKKKGLDKVKEVISGKIVVLSGPSGVGKSTLINALIDDLDIKTGEVSHKIGRGKHTTRHVQLYHLDESAYLADTPGFTAVDINSISSRELSDYYPDFIKYTDDCLFNDCLHYKEKKCGVKQAVSNLDIAEFRYRNYINILEEIIKNERCY